MRLVGRTSEAGPSLAPHEAGFRKQTPFSGERILHVWFRKPIWLEQKQRLVSETSRFGTRKIPILVDWLGQASAPTQRQARASSRVARAACRPCRPRAEGGAESDAGYFYWLDRFQGCNSESIPIDRTPREQQHEA